MPIFRLNHLELTLPRGWLAAERANITAFYGDVFGFKTSQFQGLQTFVQEHAVLSLDEHDTQFLLLAEHDHPLQSRAPDHLGLLCETRKVVDDVLGRCKAWCARDNRIEILELDDLVMAETHTATHSFYVKYLLPIWFDIQVIEYAIGYEPKKRWAFC
jgi:hypothetical protein